MTKHEPPPKPAGRIGRRGGALALNIPQLVLLGFLLFQKPAQAGLDTEISETNRVIVRHPRYEPTPTAQDCQKALVAIQSFLENANTRNPRAKGEISNVLAHAKEYRVRFYPMLQNRKNPLKPVLDALEGRKVIECMFDPAQGGEVPGWREGPGLDFEDGGFWHWRICYDPSTGKCERLHINGTPGAFPIWIE